MPIVETEFENEKELEDWVKEHIEDFLGSNLQLGGFRITTPSGKHGVPDGFVFDLANRSWHIVECELSRHGVWPHIAEQITRFAVAGQHPASRRTIRDRLFEHILGTGLLESAVRDLDTTPERFHQMLELFLLSVQPSLVVFIDETSQDLEDMANALDLPVSIYRVQKLLVDGRVGIYSPDQSLPALEVEPEEQGGGQDAEFQVLQVLGGGALKGSSRRFKCYELAVGDVVNIKRSKLHERGDYYWYGISSSALEHITTFGVTHIVFVMDGSGFVKVPLAVIEDYLPSSGTSLNADGTIRHHHVLISNTSPPKLYWSNDTNQVDLSEYFYTFD